MKEIRILQEFGEKDIPPSHLSGFAVYLTFLCESYGDIKHFSLILMPLSRGHKNI